MLHRVARALRLLLLVTGIVLLAWLPASFCLVLEAHASALGRSGGVFSNDGAVEFWVFHSVPGAQGASVSFELDRYHGTTMQRTLVFALFPQSPTSWVPIISIPLWLPATLALAWPVIAYLGSRHRRARRGFPVAEVRRPTGASEATDHERTLTS